GRALQTRALYRLMFEPGVRTAYLSYPMQHAEGDRAALASFKQRLDERLLVFDPADVNDFEIEGSSAGPPGPVPALLADGTASGSLVDSDTTAIGEETGPAAVE